jgi:hypothetical protein
MMMRREARLASRTYGVLALAAMLASGCFFMRDPLDPLGELDHRAVRELTRAEQTARSRSAYERARGRITGVKRGMSAAETEVVLGATVIAERHDENEDEAGLPRKKLIDGWLCTTEPSGLRQRWLFGYDEGGVELVGFAIELERSKPDDDDWVVRGIDRDPADDCPDAGDEGASNDEAPR